MRLAKRRSLTKAPEFIASLESNSNQKSLRTKLQPKGDARHIANHFSQRNAEEMRSSSRERTHEPTSNCRRSSIQRGIGGVRFSATLAGLGADSFRRWSTEFLWAWFKPAAVPQGLIVRIPDEASQAQSLTLRTVLHLTGVDSTWVAMWQVYGMAYPGMNGANPLLDQPLPTLVAGADPNLVVFVAARNPAT